MENYIGTLTKIQSNHSNLRTDEIKGRFNKLPTINSYFTIYGESLTSPGNGVRIVSTSEILKIVSEKELSDGYECMTFHTQNSVYSLRFKKNETIYIS